MEVVVALRRSAWALLTPVILVGGIITGLFTPTEAAGVAVVYAIFITLAVYRNVGLRDLFSMFCEAAEYVGVIMVLVAAAICRCGDGSGSRRRAAPSCAPSSRRSTAPSTHGSR
jgi:TRAP-type C4-dicarboxylate transport system permease large subunit